MAIDPDDFAARVEYLASLGRLVVPRAFGFLDQRIAFSGYGPFDIEDLARLLPVEVEWFEDQDLPENLPVDVIVLGQEGFLEDAIVASLRYNKKPLRFLPQEGFVDEFLFGHDWWNKAVDWLDTVSAYHPGLQYVRSLQTFPWPSTEASESAGVSKSEADFQLETRLYRLGYQITDRSRRQRWKTLETVAVPELGLQEVAETIARHCRNRKRQKGGRERFKYAIAEWEFDLARLKKEFYDGRHRFAWPPSEP